MNSNEARRALAIAAGWRTSSHSGGTGDCVECETIPGWVGFRDSKLGDTSPILAVTTEAADAFLTHLKARKCDGGTGIARSR